MLANLACKMELKKSADRAGTCTGINIISNVVPMKTRVSRSVGAEIPQLQANPDAAAMEPTIPMEASSIPCTRDSKPTVTMLGNLNHLRLKRNGTWVTIQSLLLATIRIMTNLSEKIKILASV